MRFGGLAGSKQLVRLSSREVDLLTSAHNQALSLVEQIPNAICTCMVQRNKWLSSNHWYVLVSILSRVESGAAMGTCQLGRQPPWTCSCMLDAELPLEKHLCAEKERKHILMYVLHSLDMYCLFLKLNHCSAGNETCF